MSARCALVTGSGGGLGLAIAEALAADGMDVALHGPRPDDDLSAAAAGLAARWGVRTGTFVADFADVASIAPMLEAVAERLGNPVVLVNNAAVRHSAACEAFPAEAWDRALAVNLSAAFHLVRLSLPAMKASGGGRIVNVSSVYGLRGARDRIAYVTTKTALIGFTRALALELAGDGITCNAICPGTVATPPIRDRLAALAAERGTSVEAVEVDYLAERQPTRRFVDAGGVGGLVAYLCGEAAADITGAVLTVDGGWSAM